MAESEEELKSLLMKVKDESEKVGLKLLDSVGEREGGMIWENGIEICIISYMKQASSIVHQTWTGGLFHI